MHVAAEDTRVLYAERGDEGIVYMLLVGCGHIARTHPQPVHNKYRYDDTQHAQRVCHGAAECGGGRRLSHLCECLLRGSQSGGVCRGAAHHAHHVGHRHVEQKREGYGHDRTQSYDGQPQHIKAHAAGAEGAHESRAHLQAERIDEQRQTERLGKEQHLRIDRHAEVSGHNAGKEYERDTQRHAPDVYLAQQQPHGAHDRDDDDGLQGRMRHEERFEHYRYSFLSLLSYLHLLKQVRRPAYAVDDE